MTPESAPPAGAEAPGPRALRAFYFFHLLATGALVPYLPAFLRALGASGTEIALVVGCTPLLHMATPFVWGWLADRTRRPDRLLLIATLGAALAALPLAGARGPGALVAANLVLQLFFTALPGLTDSLALQRVRQTGDDYGRIRAWGSTGFIVSALALGQALDRLPARGGAPAVVWLLPPLLSVLFALAFATALPLRARGAGPRPTLRDVRQLLQRPSYLFLLAVGALHWGATAPFHTFFAVLVRDLGLPAAVLGQSFALSVLSEVLVFWYARRLLSRWPLERILLIACAGSALRWLLTAVARHPGGLIATQALHGLTFGAFWTAAVAWLGACVPPTLRATGQTLFTGSVFGLGYLVGLLGAGRLYDHFGRVQPAFQVSTGVALALATAVAVYGRRVRPTLVG